MNVSNRIFAILEDDKIIRLTNHKIYEIASFR